jgi:hypothetical protein
MTSLDGYCRPAVMEFMYHMERRLRANEIQDTWGGDYPHDLFVKAIGQMGRLGLSMTYEWTTRPDEIAVRCADAANFLMMIHDLAKREYETRRVPVATPDAAIASAVTAAVEP